jgi:hypothetical protein
LKRHQQPAQHARAGPPRVGEFTPLWWYRLAAHSFLEDGHSRRLTQHSHEEEDMPAPQTTGIWLNKRAIATLEFSFTHLFRPTQDGWEVEASSPGILLVRLAQGGEQRIDVRNGSQLRSSGEELYLVLK